MLSCRSQEDQGETSCTEGPGSVGGYPDVCHLLHLYVVPAVTPLFVGVLARSHLSIFTKEMFHFRA